MRTIASDVIDRSVLRSLPTFAGCRDEDLDQVLPRMPLVTAGVGEVLVAEGDRGDFAYVIVSGTASVWRGGMKLASLEPGDLFGEMAMVAGGLRVATVRASTAVELLQLDAPSLASLTGTQTIAWNILQALLERIHRRSEPARVEPSRDAAPPAPVAEFLSVAERVVVAPSVGVFRPRATEDSSADAETITTGQVIGYIDCLGQESEVRSPFSGFLMGMLALQGEHVHVGQPIAWLRTF